MLWRSRCTEKYSSSRRCSPEGHVPENNQNYHERRSFSNRFGSGSLNHNYSQTRMLSSHAPSILPPDSHITELTEWDRAWACPRKKRLVTDGRENERRQATLKKTASTPKYRYTDPVVLEIGYPSAVFVLESLEPEEPPPVRNHCICKICKTTIHARETVKNVPRSTSCASIDRSLGDKKKGNNIV